MFIIHFCTGNVMMVIHNCVLCSFVSDNLHAALYTKEGKDFFVFCARIKSLARFLSGELYGSFSMHGRWHYVIRLQLLMEVFFFTHEWKSLVPNDE